MPEAEYTRQQLKDAGVTPIICPSCHEDFSNPYNHGHKIDCKVPIFLAKLSMWEKAKKS